MINTDTAVCDQRLKWFKEGHAVSRLNGNLRTSW